MIRRVLSQEVLRSKEIPVLWERCSEEKCDGVKCHSTCYCYGESYVQLLQAELLMTMVTILVGIRVGLREYVSQVTQVRSRNLSKSHLRYNLQHATETESYGTVDWDCCVKRIGHITYDMVRAYSWVLAAWACNLVRVVCACSEVLAAW